MRTSAWILTAISMLALSTAWSAAPGPAKQDKDLPPTQYDAMTEMKEIPLPPLPRLGPAGFVFKDPTFGTRIVRVTDEKTDAGRPCRTPSASEHNSFNADSSMFFVLGEGGLAMIFKFNHATMKVERVMDPKDPKAPLDLSSTIGGGICFSYTDPNVAYGHSAKGHHILKYDFAANRFEELVDLDKAVGGNAVRIGMLSPSRTGVLAVNFGGTKQNEDPWELVYDTKTKTSHLLNTMNSTLDGKPLRFKIGQKMHNSHIDLSGRYVCCTLASTGAREIVWDTVAGEVYPADAFRNHRAAGFGMVLSNAGLSELTREGVAKPKIFNSLMDRTAIMHGHDGHWTWNNAREGVLLPAFFSNYPQVGANVPNRLLLGEIDGVATDGSDTIWRFAHHRSTFRGEFWDSPRGNVSPDGHYIMFTSNWEETVGKGRQDVFIVELSRKPWTAAPTEPEAE